VRIVQPCSRVAPVPESRLYLLADARVVLEQKTGYTLQCQFFALTKEGGIKLSSVHSLPPFVLLLVEDDKTVREIVARVVASKFPECTIYSAENGKQGLELFKKYTPDLVVTDINMPEMDGIEMAREIKAINPNATYIVLSARNDGKNVEKFKEIGFCAYLVKPLEFKALFDAIENCHPEANPRL